MAPHKPQMNFKTLQRTDVPQGRNGKHKLIVDKILSDLDQLKEGSALRIPLVELEETKEKVRSALNRATRKGGRAVNDGDPLVATATDADFLYVWNQKK